VKCECEEKEDEEWEEYGKEMGGIKDRRTGGQRQPV